jgi:hypothetical protein
MEINIFYNGIKFDYGDTAIRFRTNSKSEYVPLIMILHNKRKIPLFTENYCGFFKNLENPFTFKYTQRVYKFSRSMIRARYNNEDYNSRYISISMLSIFGIKDKLESGISNLKQGDSPNVNIYNNIDVFALAVIKKSNIRKIKNEKEKFIIDSQYIKILVSKEKFKSPKYMNINYNATSGRHLLREFNLYTNSNDIEQIVVSDEELKKFYYNPFALKTNSIMEAMEEDQNIKEVVFHKLQHNLVYD